jgi:hypothetical protein
LIKELNLQMAEAIASLVAIGRRSGDTVVGLSSVRRTKKLAVILADESLALRTFNELAKLTKDGFGVFKVSDILSLTGRFGREDIRVIGVVRGPLADGILKKLEKFEKF